MKRWLFQSKRWLKLKDFYWISELDIRDVEKMKSMWVKQEDIDFIIGKKEIPKEEFTALDLLKKEAKELWIDFNARIWEDKLQEKINLVKNGQ